MPKIRIFTTLKLLSEASNARYSTLLVESRKSNQLALHTLFSIIKVQDFTLAILLSIVNFSLLTKTAQLYLQCTLNNKNSHQDNLEPERYQQCLQSTTIVKMTAQQEMALRKHNRMLIFSFVI